MGWTIGIIAGVFGAVLVFSIIGFIQHMRNGKDDDSNDDGGFDPHIG